MRHYPPQMRLVVRERQFHKSLAIYDGLSWHRSQNSADFVSGRKIVIVWSLWNKCRTLTVDRVEFVSHDRLKCPSERVEVGYPLQCACQTEIISSHQMMLSPCIGTYHGNQGDGITLMEKGWLRELLNCQPMRIDRFTVYRAMASTKIPATAWAGASALKAAASPRKKAFMVMATVKTIRKKML